MGQLGFWKGPVLDDPHGLFKANSNKSTFGVHAASLAELPSDDVLLDYMRRALRRIARSAQRRCRWHRRSQRR